MITVSTQLAPEDDLQVFARMLESVSFADEIRIYLMDLDQSLLSNIVKKYHPVMIPVKTPPVVEVIRSRQVTEAQNDWVLIMDFDEVITPELASEIQAIQSSSVAAYKIRRKNFSLGFPVSHGGFGDDYVHRLFNRRLFVAWPTNIHSTPQVKGKVTTLTNFMQHHKDASISQMVTKTNRYSEVEAQQFLDGGMAPVTTLTLIRKPVMEFIRRYFIKLGFLDGRIGILQAIYQSYSVFISYSKLFELQQKSNKVEHNI